MICCCSRCVVHQGHFVLFEKRLLALSARRSDVALICEQWFRRSLLSGCVMGSMLLIAKICIGWVRDCLVSSELSSFAIVLTLRFHVFFDLQCVMLFS